MNSAAPEGSVDEFTRKAIAALQLLAPAAAATPGLLLAAGCVDYGMSEPFVVVTSNDGAGWMPAGFVLPRTMVHAQTDLWRTDFGARWYGWADPARIIVDYADTLAATSGRPVSLLGLASTGSISEATDAAWGDEGRHRGTGGRKSVPNVRPEPGSQPLKADEEGRFRPRLQVVDREMFDGLVRKSYGVQLEAAAVATEAAMRTRTAASLTNGGPWQLIQSRGGLFGGGLSTDEWDRFGAAYESDSAMCGALRPGFRSDSVPGESAFGQYGLKFRELRAAEALLGWRDPSSVEPLEIVYCAAVANADLGECMFPFII